MAPHEEGKRFFQVGDRTVLVQSRDPALMREVETLFPDYATDGRDRDMTEYRARRAGVGWLLERFGKNPAQWMCTSRSGVVDELEYALTLEFMSANPRSPFIHGSAALAKPDVAVLVLGKSGAGKSSTALHWSVNGRPVFGDDVVRLEPEGKISAFKRLFEVDARRLKKLGVRNRSGPFWLPTSPEVWFDPREYGGWTRGSHRVGLVALLDRARDGHNQYTEAGADEALGWLTASLMPEGLGVGQCFDELICVVTNARCVRAAVSDIGVAARSLIEMVE